MSELRNRAVVIKQQGHDFLLLLTYAGVLEWHREQSKKLYSGGSSPLTRTICTLNSSGRQTSLENCGYRVSGMGLDTSGVRHTYGVRSIMDSTAVCGTASLSSILSVPTMRSCQIGYVVDCKSI